MGKNRLLLFTIFLPPLLLTLLPLAILGLAGPAMASAPNMPPDQLERYRALSPAFAQYTPGEIIQTVILSQFLLFFLLMPLIIPVTIAAASIIGEKELRSLEPLLATPVRTVELLAGKSFAAMAPAILTTWGAYVIFFIGARLIVTSDRVFSALLDPKWLLAMLLLAPLLSLLSVSLGVIVSARVNDTRAAQQIVGVIVLPLVLLGVGQTTGLILLNTLTFVLGALVIALLDAGILYLGARLFQRETILTRWK